MGCSRSPLHRLVVTDLPKCAEKASDLLSSLREQEIVVWVPLGEMGRGFFHIFVVRKPSGKFRLILNLKPLKVSVTYRRF